MSPDGSPIRHNEETRQRILLEPEDDTITDILSPTRGVRVKKKVALGASKPTSPKVVITKNGKPVRRGQTLKANKPRNRKDIGRTLSPEDGYAKQAATRKKLKQVKSQPGSPAYKG